MRIKHIIALLSTVAIISCGGGGGGGSSAPKSFAGLWTGVLYKTGDTCSFGDPDSLTVAHGINQNGSRVVVDIPSGRTTYEGTLDGTNGFTVGQEPVNQPVGNGALCRLQVAMRYTATDEDRADVQQGGRFQCTDGTGSKECEVTYAGEVTRDSK
jgi:hypothetical protein